ncbi:phospholipase domain-containing protein, partial [Acinetobacter guillouiae]
KISVKAGQTSTRHWELKDTWQWYDFAVTCTQDTKFYRRFAGRVETGADSVSDPAMV